MGKAEKHTGVYHFTYDTRFMSTDLRRLHMTRAGVREEMTNMHKMVFEEKRDALDCIVQGLIDQSISIEFILLLAASGLFNVFQGEIYVYENPQN
jgi:hypothetical protein